VGGGRNPDGIHQATNGDTGTDAEATNTACTGTGTGDSITDTTSIHQTLAGVA
jgi:hypothetical protein